MKRLTGALLLLALQPMACARHSTALVPCALVPKAPDSSPSEITQFEDCGHSTERGIVLEQDHLRQLYFDADGLGYVLTRGRAFYVLPSGKSVETVVYDSGPDYFVEGLARGVAGGKIGFVNRALEFEIAPAYDFAFPLDHGYAVVCNGCVSVEVDGGEHHVMQFGLWGVIDRSGRVVVPLEHSKDELHDSPAYKALVH